MNLIKKYCPKTEFSNYDDFYNNFELNVPETFNFGFDIVDEYAKLDGKKKALVWCDDIGNERIFDFAEMKKYSDKAANFLLSKGIKKGDSVMLILQRRYEYWYLLVACCKIGATAIPATHLLTKKDIEYRCNLGDVKMIICIDEPLLMESILESKEHCPALQTLATIGKHEGFLNLTEEVENSSEILNSPYKPSRSDRLFLYFTSGTTGMPKMVMHDQAYPLGHVVTALYWQKVLDDGLHFTLAETGWAKCSWGKIFGQWICGSAVFVFHFTGKFQPLHLLPALEKYKVTTFCAPPTVYRFMIKEDLSCYNFSSLKHLSTAGEALNPEVFKQIKEKTGLSIYEGYGQTESSIILGTFSDYNGVKVGSMGKPSPMYEVFLADDDDNPVEPGEDGEIVIKLKKDQKGLFRGYYKDEAITASAIKNGIYHTGDLAYMDEDGYYWFVGRKDDIIKSSGYRIGPFEVESALMEHPAVLECAITAVPDELRGQIVKATIVLAKGFNPSDELVKELQNHVKKVTAPYKYPRVVEFVEELPKTISGKIKRAAIRKNEK